MRIVILNFFAKIEFLIFYYLLSLEKIIGIWSRKQTKYHLIKRIPQGFTSGNSFY